ncbi:MAG: DUF488 domain-containing protein [Chitinophagaceae bacterium]|jgi:uncharacterized protein (DUF488 family)|nr:DUF488 domain-containing protein [Candidatus Brachybacter algidus]MBK6378243.1 DUF488 domain-containing protein [Chitinophagaceae bacterium]MBK8749272.1 DUF488 domain-containing protein [Candidatus Brachybacter algidus]MBL0305695.1 DUF488 domain-containing protein [Chitinophagaceae bacterium]HQW43712.1 DUF488 domain-containing protein [Chitinophagaceae bacterium]
MSKLETHTIYTIGHSTHSLDEFLNLLRSFDIKIIADIRSLPGSRRFPQFNMENLKISLEETGIQYIHLADLGGRRKMKKDSKNNRWNNDSFRGYADYMETNEFENAIVYLEDIALAQRTAYMCSEAVWWRCHRSMVSDYLKVRGWQVMHIMGIGKAEEHPYTAPARIVNGALTYKDASVQ